MVFSFKYTSKKRRRCKTNPTSFVAKIQKIRVSENKNSVFFAEREKFIQ